MTELLLAHLMGQYCFARWHLSLSSVIVCRLYRCRRAGRPPGAWTVGALGRHLVLKLIILSLHSYIFCFTQVAVYCWYWYWCHRVGIR